MVKICRTVPTLALQRMRKALNYKVDMIALIQVSKKSHLKEKLKMTLLEEIFAGIKFCGLLLNYYLREVIFANCYISVSQGTKPIVVKFKTLYYWLSCKGTL